MRSYVFKNGIIFVFAIVTSIIVFGIIQYFSSDREILRIEARRLEEAQLEFKKKIAKTIDKEFQIIEFVANTTYPQAALELFYDKPFYNLWNGLGATEGIGIFLLDGEFHFISHEGAGADTAEYLRRNPLSFPEKKTLYVLGRDVLAVYPIFAPASRELIGFLGGVISIDRLTAAIHGAYRDSTSFLMGTSKNCIYETKFLLIS